MGCRFLAWHRASLRLGAGAEAAQSVPRNTHHNVIDGDAERYCVGLMKGVCWSWRRTGSEYTIGNHDLSIEIHHFSIGNRQFQQNVIHL